MDKIKEKIKIIFIIKIIQKIIKLHIMMKHKVIKMMFFI